MMLSAVVALFQMSAVVQTNDGVVLRNARKAQIRFEAIRRAHLPWDRSGGSPGGGRCDARIGRYCYWYDSSQTTVVPEPAQIGAARAKLLGVLDSAAAIDPSDAWIVGQRVRYLIEGGYANAAVVVGSRCRAERWWCAALTGLALHVAERYDEADSAFTIALGAMPAPQRCEWIDLRRMTEGPLERELSRATCAEREALANRLWELSQPFWSVPGNDLRTEHLARHTMAIVLSRSANGHGMPWGEDSRELLLRYGWAEWFTRQGADFGGVSTTPRVTGHDREPSYYFLPAIPSVRVAPRLTLSSWRLREPLARTRYAPRYLKGLTDLPHQLARFPRGDSMLVAVAYRVVDTALARDSLSAQLCHPERCARDDNGGGIMHAMVPRDSVVMSLEVRGERSKRASRARYTIDPLPCAAAWCLSDLVLFEASAGGAGAASDVDSVLSHAAAELNFTNRTPLGVFWEIQGARDSPVSVWLSLTVLPLRVSLARRVATSLKLAPAIAPVRLRWQETIRLDRQGQQVTLRLPSNARGKYRVLLTVEAPGVQPLTAFREIDVSNPQAR